MLLKWVPEGEHIRGTFHKEVFRNNELGLATSWGVIERPLKMG